MGERIELTNPTVTDPRPDSEKQPTKEVKNLAIEVFKQFNAAMHAGHLSSIELCNEVDQAALNGKLEDVIRNEYTKLFTPPDESGASGN